MLYAWAKVWKRSLSITDEFTICMATGDNEYEEAEKGTYKAIAPGKLSSKLMVRCGASEKPCIAAPRPRPAARLCRALRAAGLPLEAALTRRGWPIAALSPRRPPAALRRCGRTARAAA